MDSFVCGNCAVCVFCPLFFQKRACWELILVFLVESPSAPVAEHWAAWSNLGWHKLVLKSKAWFQSDNCLRRTWLCSLALWILVFHTGRLLSAFFHQYWWIWRCHFISQNSGPKWCSCNCTAKVSWWSRSINHANPIFPNLVGNSTFYSIGIAYKNRFSMLSLWCW